MNWNIEHLSENKLNIPGLAEAIARTVRAANVDVVIFLEVKITNVIAAMHTLSAALNHAQPGAAGHNWKGWFLSYETGVEHYAVFIKDLSVVRPIHVYKPQTHPAEGSQDSPLTNLRRDKFRVWPNNFAGPVGYPIAGRPYLPLINLFAAPKNPRATKRARGFGGIPLDRGGYSMGRGFRLPVLAMLQVLTPAGNSHVLPFVACHYAAVRYQNQRNHLGQGQVSQLKLTHIAQLFSNNPGAAGAMSGYLNIRDNADHNHAVAVQELCFTGDFNLDFRRNLLGGGNVEDSNRRAFDTLTPTIQNGGSAAPAAAPGAVPMLAPAVPFAYPYNPQAAYKGNIANQALKAAVTDRGTILRRLNVHAAPAQVFPPYARAAFDNFFYGGANLANANLVAGEAGRIIDVPGNVVQNPAPGWAQIDLTAVATYYAGRGRKNAHLAPGLINMMVAPIGNRERLIGANLVSDHLPVILQFPLP
jgi:hypothetical protein